VTIETDAAEQDPIEDALILGPDEIVGYELSIGRKGYAIDEVNDLLDQLAAQTQDLMTALRAAELARDSLRTSIEDARQQDDLMHARAATNAEAMLSRAADRADELRDAAMRRARAAEEDASRRRGALADHIEHLRTFAEDHQARLQHHLEVQLERLGAIDLPAEPPLPDQVVDEDLGRTIVVTAEPPSNVDGSGDAPPAVSDGSDGAVNEDLSAIPVPPGSWTMVPLYEL
jgi:cell division septum initiation protein DivIVA